MNSIPISKLPDTTLPYTGNEELLITQNGATKAGALSSLTTYFSGGTILAQHIMDSTPTGRSLITSTNTSSALLSVVNSMTELEKQELLPNTVEVDYFLTSDQSGYTIPDHCFGRKGDKPYFGDIPLGDSTDTRYINAAIQNSTTSSYRWTRPLAVFDLPENILMSNAETYFIFEVDLLIETFGTPPFGESGTGAGMCIMLALDNELSVITDFYGGQVIIDINPFTSGRSTVYLRGQCMMFSADSMISGGSNALIKRDFSNSTYESTERPLSNNGDEMSFMSGPGPNPDSPGEATHLNFIVAPIAGQWPTSINSILVSGKVSFKPITFLP
jgi:hypothetical protein